MLAESTNLPTHKGLCPRSKFLVCPVRKHCLTQTYQIWCKNPMQKSEGFQGVNCHHLWTGASRFWTNTTLRQWSTGWPQSSF